MTIFGSLSSEEEKNNFEKIKTKKEKQDRNFIETDAHITQSTAEPINIGEQWISWDGSTARLNIRLKNGDIYYIPMTRIP